MQIYSFIAIVDELVLIPNWARNILGIYLFIGKGSWI
jgi:hypothetical protein